MPQTRGLPLHLAPTTMTTAIKPLYKLEKEFVLKPTHLINPNLLKTPT